jgi:hypothetical protein
MKTFQTWLQRSKLKLMHRLSDPQGILRKTMNSMLKYMALKWKLCIIRINRIKSQVRTYLIMQSQIAFLIMQI